MMSAMKLLDFIAKHCGIYRLPSKFLTNIHLQVSGPNISLKIRLLPSIPISLVFLRTKCGREITTSHQAAALKCM